MIHVGLMFVYRLPVGFACGCCLLAVGFYAGLVWGLRWTDAGSVGLMRGCNRIAVG